MIDPNVGKVCYAVTAADVDGDNRLDIVAIGEREAMWYRNPDWKKHVMISDAVTKITCTSLQAISMVMGKSTCNGCWLAEKRGEIFWIQRSKSLQSPWKVHPIGAEPGRIA